MKTHMLNNLMRRIISLKFKIIGDMTKVGLSELCWIQLCEGGNTIDAGQGAYCICSFLSIVSFLREQGISVPRNV